MRKIFHRLVRFNPRGVSLIEVLVGVFLITTVVATLAVFVPRAIRSSTSGQARIVGSQLAASLMQATKSHPFFLITPTPSGAYFPQGTNCNCQTADFTQLPSQPVTVGKVAYTEQVCVNNIFTTEPVCPGPATYQLKDILVKVSWQVGGTPQSFQMESQVARFGQSGGVGVSTGSFSVLPCKADPTNPLICDGSNTTAVNGAEISLSNGGYFGENGGIFNYPNPAYLNVSAGTYDLQVQFPGYFPFHQSGIVVTPGTSPPPLNVYLRSIADYGDHVSGEVFVATHPVISQVVGYVLNSFTASCGIQHDDSEALEIYNPSSFTYCVGANNPGIGCTNANKISVNYSGNLNTACNSATATTIAFNGVQYTYVPPTTGGTKTKLLAPGNFMLLSGNDSISMVHNPEWGITPDIAYSVTPTNRNSGFIDTACSGGIQLLVNNAVVDQVVWVGIATLDGHPAGPLPFGAVTGLPAGTLMQGSNTTVGTCSPTGFSSLIRYSRRGQPNAIAGGASFGVNGAPGDASGALGWGYAYNTDVNANNFGNWTYPVAPYNTAVNPPPLHNVSSGTFLSRTGTPATRYFPGSTYIQVGDPTSPPTLAIHLPTGYSGTANLNDYTSVLTAGQVMGPDSIDLTLETPGLLSWPAIIVAGPNISTTTLSVLSSANASVWHKTFQAPYTPSTPPQPCSGGGNPCDTSQDTIPDPPLVPGELDYGPNPDSLTPYVILTSAPSAGWGFISGTVLAGNSGLGAISVEISDKNNPPRFAAFEKATDVNGNFNVLLPGSFGGGSINFVFNSSSPLNGYTPYTHYWNAHYSSATFSETYPSWNPPGTPLTPAPTDFNPLILPLSPSAFAAMGLLSGQVLAAEQASILQNIPIELLQNTGLSYKVATTDVNGNYQFLGLLDGDYYVRPVLDRTWSASPLQIPVTVSGGAANPVSANFTIRGVRANLSVSAASPGCAPAYGAGTFVIVTTMTLPGSPPAIPSLNFGQSYPLVYSATIGQDPTVPVTFQVKPGVAYNMYCWTLNNNLQYAFQSSVINLDSGPVPPQFNGSIACPSTSCP